jgi:hypothetical protein
MMPSHSVTYYTKFLVTVSVPLALLLVISVFCLGPLLLLDKCDMNDDGAARARRRRWRNNTVRLLLFTV